MPRVLLTGFDAFGGESINPSWLAVRPLHGRQVASHRIVAAQLPTVFDKSILELARLMRLHTPALVICVGQAGGRDALSLERVAINVNDARIADNASAQPVDTPVVAGAPTAYFSTLPIKAMLQALQREGLAAEVSQTAGTFVCNHVFYGLMRQLATQPACKHTRGGFIHVPYLAGQGQPCMALEDLTRGLHIATRTALTTQRDTAYGAGAVS
ncbi:MAG: pyroglutamyl-peptidase I [Polaromonas sp.]|uniref:pyroglutamyl-peptidase I n=1 Tax=Polaromonas sp. TaxID=1869339 RepID=UPI00272FC7DD|nr:pyroglutamyl-peptidase I [Polaromonas sp.]MDP1740293.1 pyroglutamyl-peptidase I [Polaromonas sp.]MDP1956125.1 pyroglutamyl-peptidase I [Polaromonas sp.]MDP3356255.1 pyroglutamyl-peptidase I [Polaromonas sp.]MDP3752932.1 pyroglutamyl-peptidase I [Polaromonas sp.]